MRLSYFYKILFLIDVTVNRLIYDTQIAQYNCLSFTELRRMFLTLSSCTSDLMQSKKKNVNSRNNKIIIIILWRWNLKEIQFFHSIKCEQKKRANMCSEMTLHLIQGLIISM